MKVGRIGVGLVVGALVLLSYVMAQPPAPLGKTAQTAVQDNNHFATDLYGQLRAQPGNLFFSPYSISTALAMTYAGAEGKTADQMAKVLHFSGTPAQLHAAFGEILTQVNRAGAQKPPYQLHVANALWGQQGFHFLPAFRKVTQHQYGAGLKEVDFVKQTEQARQTINQWVEEKTQDKIQDLIPAGVLDAETRLVLTNAIYFKSAWAKPFEKRATQQEGFHVTEDDAVKVPMMHKNEEMPYLGNPTFQAVSIPYVRNELSMVVLLPRKIGGLADLEKTLTAEHLTEVLKSMKRHQVDLKLPRFQTTAQFNLKDTLVKMGMPLAFSNRADFSGMSSEEKLKISEVIHKAFVDVNEAGTEAAAATAVVMTRLSAIQPHDPAAFHADHPFIFMIRENRTGSILFVGRVMNPR